jgi:hypothetical protein
MSDTIPVYRGLARAFRLEDVDTIFVLTGDGNMHWEAALSEDEEVKSLPRLARALYGRDGVSLCRSIGEGRRGIGDMWAGCHPTDDSAGDHREQQNTTRRFRW